MKKQVSILLVYLALFSGAVFFSGSVMAHADHGRISGQTAIGIAMKSVKQMTFKDFGFGFGKLAPSWKDITASDVSVHSVNAEHFVVKADNAKDDKTIYFKISVEGQLLTVYDKESM